VTNVYLHGFLGAPAAWRDVLQHLAPHTAITPTLPGHGTSPWTPAGTFTDIVDAFTARTLGPEPVTLVGYSLGARVALSIALRHPSRIAHLVLVSGAYGLDLSTDRESRVRADEALADALERDGVARFVDAWESIPLFESQRSLPNERLDAQRAWRTQHTARGLAWSLRALGLGRQPPYRMDFSKSTMPVTLVTGARDEKFTALAREMVRMRTNVSHTVVEGVGHNVVLEAPEAVAVVLEDHRRPPPELAGEGRR
jgi:2-succinyl-6-hydroxy-2,4-cyclohexadiene-1-carboxylate synthase